MQIVPSLTYCIINTEDGKSGKISGMKTKIFVREISKQERQELEAGLRSADSFVMRRSQVILFSAEGMSICEIAGRVGYGRESVRLVIQKFNENGTAILKKGSRRPHHIYPAYTAENAEKLKAILRRSPREFGKPTSLWTLELLAEVSYEEGLTEKQVSAEAVRQTLKKLGIQWKRAKHWITSPDAHYTHKKTLGKSEGGDGTTIGLGNRVSG